MTALNHADKIRVGATAATAVYVGDAQVWPAKFDPAKLLGLLWWADSSQLALADGAPVTDIPDLSGNGLTTSSRFGQNPTFKTSAAGALGALTFAGSTPTGALTIAGLGTALTGLSTFTVLIALAPSAFDNYPIVFASPIDDSWQWVLEFDTQGGVYLGVASGFAPLFGPGPPIGAWSIMTWVHDGPTDRLWIDSTEVFTTGVGVGGQSSIPYLGADVILGGYYNDLYGLLADLGEVLIYSQALSDADRQALIGYLSAKWTTGAATTQLPARPAAPSSPPSHLPG